MTDQEKEGPDDDKQVRRQRLEEERRRRSSANYSGDHQDGGPRTTPYKREQHRNYYDLYEEDF